MDWPAFQNLLQNCSDPQSLSEVIQRADLLFSGTNSLHPHFRQAWEDIFVLVSSSPNTFDKIHHAILNWKNSLVTYQSDYDTLIAVFHLRISLLNIVYESTNSLFLSTIKASKSNAIKPHLIQEIETLLDQLEKEEDKATIDKLRDRFSFLSNIVHEITANNE